MKEFMLLIRNEANSKSGFSAEKRQGVPGRLQSVYRGTAKRRKNY